MWTYSYNIMHPLSINEVRNLIKPLWPYSMHRHNLRYSSVWKCSYRPQFTCNWPIQYWLIKCVKWSTAQHWKKKCLGFRNANTRSAQKFVDDYNNAVICGRERYAVYEDVNNNVRLCLDMLIVILLRRKSCWLLAASN